MKVINYFFKKSIKQEEPIITAEAIKKLDPLENLYNINEELIKLDLEQITILLKEILENPAFKESFSFILKISYEIQKLQQETFVKLPLLSDYFNIYIFLADLVNYKLDITIKNNKIVNIFTLTSKKITYLALIFLLIIYRYLFLIKINVIEGSMLIFSKLPNFEENIAVIYKDKIKQNDAQIKQLDSRIKDLQDEINRKNVEKNRINTITNEITDKLKSIEQIRSYTNPVLKQPEDPDKFLCKVCYSGKNEQALLPCGHFCICNSCIEIIMSDTQKCPICKVLIENTLKVYIT